MRKASISHRIRRKIRNRDSVYHPRNKRYKWFVLFNIMLGTFMAVLDATIVNVGLPKIMASFGVGLDKIQWVATAYMLAMAVTLPLPHGWQTGSAINESISWVFSFSLLDLCFVVCQTMRMYSSCLELFRGLVPEQFNLWVWPSLPGNFRLSKEVLPWDFGLWLQRHLFRLDLW